MKKWPPGFANAPTKRTSGLTIWRGESLRPCAQMGGCPARVTLAAAKRSRILRHAWADERAARRHAGSHPRGTGALRTATRASICRSARLIRAWVRSSASPCTTTEKRAGRRRARSATVRRLIGRRSRCIAGLRLGGLRGGIGFELQQLQGVISTSRRAATLPARDARLRDARPAGDLGLSQPAVPKPPKEVLHVAHARILCDVA